MGVLSPARRVDSVEAERGRERNAGIREGEKEERGREKSELADRESAGYG